MRSALLATAEALFANGPDWPALVEAGFPLLLVPEAAGGVGGDWGDAVAVLEAAGRHALAQPLAEAMLAASLLGDAGLVAPEGLVSVGLAHGHVTGGHLTGNASGMPWGRHAAAALVALDGDLWLLPPGGTTPGENPAGEPRDGIVWADAPAVAAGHADLAGLMGLCRAAQAAGALAAALDLAVAHVNTRVQFGKPLARQQAVQQALAVLASEVAALGLAARAAAAALDDGDAALALPAVRLRMGMAIERGVGIAHQVHGAIGFTQDYPLHRFTRRLMGWRSEWGGEQAVAEALGDAAVALGGAGLWAALTR